MGTKKRRERGTGNVRPDPSRPGSWIGAVQIDGRRYTARGRTKTDVSAKLAALKAEALTGTGRSQNDNRMTVAQLVELYIAREVPNLKRDGAALAPRTLESYDQAGALITAELGRKRLATLDVHDVEKMYDRLATRDVRPMGKASLEKLSAKLGQMLDFAVKRKYVGTNVAKLATITPTAARRRTRKSLQPDEARTLLAALHDERNGAMWALSLLCGLRPGEAAGLYWGDLALDATPPTVNVTRAVRMVRGKAIISDDLKTTASKRTVAMPADLAARLEAHRKAQVAERLAAKSWGDERLVFASPAGNVYDPSNARDDLAAICDRADVPRILPNELRHSCASLLADEGVPNESIADLLGHTTTRMVDQTYRHRLRPVVDVATRATWAQAN